jgi:ABC-2 type transport system permease protein
VSVLRPGSTLWLLRNELRLGVRSLGSSRGGGPVRVFIGLGIAFAVLATLAGVPLGLGARYLPAEPPPAVALALLWGFVAVFALMLSQALAAAVNALFTRGDLDLLLSSPLDGRTVLAVRGVGIAANPLLIYGALAVAVVVPAAAMGRPQFLAVLLVLLALTMLATSAGIGLALGLFALIGPRATRTLGQVLAAAVGASVFLFGQAQRFNRRAGANALQALLAWATPERFGPASPLSWPARAVWGAPAPLLGLLVVSGAVFALTLAGLGRRFAANAAVSAGISEAAPARGGTRPARARFARSALGAVVRKELRLLARDPALLSQVGLRVLYLLPLCFVLVRSARFGESGYLASGVALVSVVAAQVAGSLAWITVSAEDAPDLLASSPAGGERARYAKLLAALIPLAVIMVAPLLGLVVLAPWAGVVATIGVAVSSASAGLVNLWFEKPASRSNFRRRGGSIVTSLAEIALGLGWGVACALAVAGLVWTVIPVCVSVGLLFIFWLMRRPTQAY